MDDLGFAVAQDPQTADLIRKLDIKKASAVKGNVLVTVYACDLHNYRVYYHDSCNSYVLACTESRDNAIQGQVKQIESDMTIQ